MFGNFDDFRVNIPKFRVIFQSKLALASSFLLLLFRQVKELVNVEQTALKSCVKNHMKIFLIMWNSAYTQKKIISASIKTLTKLLPLPAAS